MQGIGVEHLFEKKFEQAKLKEEYVCVNMRVRSKFLLMCEVCNVHKKYERIIN